MHWKREGGGVKAGLMTGSVLFPQRGEVHPSTDSSTSHSSLAPSWWRNNAFFKSENWTASFVFIQPHMSQVTGLDTDVDAECSIPTDAGFCFHSVSYWPEFKVVKIMTSFQFSSCEYLQTSGLTSTSCHIHSALSSCHFPFDAITAYL